MNVNLRHQFFAAQAVRPHMKELGYGSIINFSSIAWHFGRRPDGRLRHGQGGGGRPDHALGRAFGADNIRVNAIEPGAVITERQLHLWYSPEEADQMAARQAIKRRCCSARISRAPRCSSPPTTADDHQAVDLVVDGGMR